MGLIEVMRERLIIPLIQSSSYEGNKLNTVEYLNHQLSELDNLVKVHFTPRLERQRVEDNIILDDYLRNHLPEVCDSARPYCPELVLEVERRVAEVVDLVYPMRLQ